MKEGFEELYTRLYNENVEELEHLRQKNKKVISKAIWIFIAIFICILVAPYLIPVAIIGTAIVVIIGTFANRNKNKEVNNFVNEYKTVFKEKIITPIIKNVFDNGTYEPERGWSRYDYEKGEYNDDIDRYSSEDMITATVTGQDEEEVNIQFAEVHTERRTKDSDGRVHYYTEFYGLAGKMPLKKDLATRIYIRKNGLGIFNKNKVKMDMSEFEKIFDVEAEDKILAVRILTADVMSEMIELYRKFKYRFEIHIIKDTIYMRLSTGNMFEPNVFKDAMEYKTVEKYYLVLQAMMRISTHIYDTINEIEL